MPIRRVRRGKTRKFRRARKGQVGLIKRVINSQTEKHAFYAPVTGSFGWNGTITDVSAVAQGGTAINRDGDKLTIKSLIYRYGVFGADVYNFCRIVIIQWLQNDAATAPTVAGVLNATYTGSLNAPFSPFNKSNAGYQFVVLYDKTHSVSTVSNYNKGGFVAKITPKKLKGKALKNIQYNAGATTGVGKFYILWISDSGVASDPGVQGVSQLRFYSN